MKLILERATRGDHKINIITQEGGDNPGEQEVIIIILLDSKFNEIAITCAQVIDRIGASWGLRNRKWVDVSEEEWAMILLSL